MSSPTIAQLVDGGRICLMAGCPAAKDDVGWSAQITEQTPVQLGWLSVQIPGLLIDRRRRIDRPSRPGPARPGPVRSRPVPARPGPVRHGPVRPRLAPPGGVRPVPVLSRPGPAPSDPARPGRRYTGSRPPPTRAHASRRFIPDRKCPS